MAAGIVVVGGGPAGYGAIAGARQAGFTGEIVLVGREEDPPYDRPPLSKRFLLEDLERAKLYFPPAEADLRLGTAVAEIEPDAHRVRLEDGSTLEYEKLLLALGSRARKLEGLADALTLRELPDAERLRERLASGRPLDIVGAGFIGCEVAAAARAHDLPVTLWETLPQPLSRVLGEQLGARLAELHRAHGVDLRTGVEELPDLGVDAVVGVGSVPNTELAEAAGLDCDRGVLADEFGRTSAPDVYVAGDCARFLSPVYGTHVRVEHFQTSQRHGRAVGRVLAGDEQPFREVHWFWTDQYDLNLQYLGAGLPWDELAVRGRLEDPSFTAFLLSSGQIVGAVAWNDGRAITQVRRLLEREVDVSLEQLTDPQTDLRALARQAD
jgi:3-phenylpropionate/trans-cinnamate dioxygenase ferredoxin reductase component